MAEELDDIDYLRDLAERLMRVPNTNAYDIERLFRIAGQLEFLQEQKKDQ